MTNLDKKLNTLQEEMKDKAKLVLFEHFSAMLSDEVTFIEWSQEPEAYNDEGYEFEINWIVASKDEEIARILDDNSEKAEWHSDDMELVAWEELLERQVDLETVRKVSYDLTRVENVLALFGDARIRITKKGIEIK